MANSIEERTYQELELLRKKLEDETKTLGSTTNRFQIFSLLALLLFSFLLANEDFRPPKWQQALERLQTWITKNKVAGPVSQIRYHQIYIFKFKHSDRKPLTETIIRTGVADKIAPETRMSDVSKILGDLCYGVDFLQLDQIEKSLVLMEEQQGARLLKDLANYHYEGGPLRQGTSLKASFFSDYTLGKHKILSEKLPYDPEMSIHDYVLSARAVLAEIKKKYPEAYKAWEEQRNEWLKKYNLSDWTWGAWQTLSDSAVSEWKEIVEDTIGSLDPSTLRMDMPNWESVINWIKGEFNRKAKEEKDAATKATVWSITLELPLKTLVLLFPLLYSAVRSILAALRLRQRINTARVARINDLIDRGLETHASTLKQLRPPRIEMSLYEIIVREKWKGLFFSYPLLFTDIAYELAVSCMALYILYRGIRLSWWPPGITPSTMIFTLAALAGLALLFLFWTTSQEAISRLRGTTN